MVDVLLSLLVINLQQPGILKKGRFKQNLPFNQYLVVSLKLFTHSAISAISTSFLDEVVQSVT